jgi:hypothetical protein
VRWLPPPLCQGLETTERARPLRPLRAAEMAFCGGDSKLTTASGTHCRLLSLGGLSQLLQRLQVRSGLQASEQTAAAMQVLQAAAASDHLQPLKAWNISRP